MIERQRAERRTSILREHHAFALTNTRFRRDDQLGPIAGIDNERRKSIVEYRPIPRPWRYFRRVRGVRRRRQRVVFRRREKRALLPVGGVGYPFSSQWMPAQVRIRFQRLGKWTRRGRCFVEWFTTKERKLPAIRLGQAQRVHYDAPEM